MSTARAIRLPITNFNQWARYNLVGGMLLAGGVFDRTKQLNRALDMAREIGHFAKRIIK